MGRFLEGCERRQTLLLVDCVDDYVGAENPVRMIDVSVDELDLAGDRLRRGGRDGSTRLPSCNAAEALSLAT